MDTIERLNARMDGIENQRAGAVRKIYAELAVLAATMTVVRRSERWPAVRLRELRQRERELLGRLARILDREL